MKLLLSIEVIIKKKFFLILTMKEHTKKMNGNPISKLKNKVNRILLELKNANKFSPEEY